MMKNFLNTATNTPHGFIDDVIFDGNQFFDALGNKLDVPDTLIPMPDDWTPPPPPPPTLEEVQLMRLSAYRAESDLLKIEAEYDALIEGVAPDYTRWREAVEAIKARYPLPAA